MLNTEEYKIKDMIREYMVAKLKYGYVPNYNLEEFLFLKEYMGSNMLVENSPLAMTKMFSNLRQEMKKESRPSLIVTDDYEIKPTYYLNKTDINEEADKIYQEYLKKYLSKREIMPLKSNDGAKMFLAKKIANILMLKNSITDIKIYESLVGRIYNLINEDKNFRISNIENNLLAYNNFLFIVDKYQSLFNQEFFQINNNYYIEISGQNKNVYQYLNLDDSENLKLVRKNI